MSRRLHCLTDQYPDHWTDLNSKASYAHRHKILFLFEVVPFVALSSYLFWQTFFFISETIAPLAKYTSRWVVWLVCLTWSQISKSVCIAYPKTKTKCKNTQPPTTILLSWILTCPMIASLLLLFRQTAIWNVRSDIWIDFKSPPHQIFLLLSAGWWYVNPENASELSWPQFPPSGK